jgi:putative flippase GtrA
MTLPINALVVSGSSGGIRNQATSLVLRFKVVGMLGFVLTLLVLVVRNSIAAQQAWRAEARSAGHALS